MSVVCFRYTGAPASVDLDTVNRAALRALQLGGRYFLAGTELDGRFYFRACIVNGRATEKDIVDVLPVIRNAVAAILM
jgi:hypothetical protein